MLLIQVLPFLLELFNLQLNLGKQILRILNRLPQVRNPAFFILDLFGCPAFAFFQSCKF